MRIIHDMKPSNGPYIDVEEAEYVDGYRLKLTFSDGSAKIVDFHDYLRDAPRPWITKYWSLDEFKNFRLLDGRLMWGDFDLIFPIADLHRGTIEYDFGRKPEIPKSAMKGSVSKPSERVALPLTTLRRLKARAQKEHMPVERLAQRLIEEGMKRQSKAAK